MSEKKKMNILLILTDQHRADHMGCSGHNEVKTPNLDNLASEGLLFNNAFCANPMCMPNRSSIITGCYPSVHGCRSNGINLPNAVTTAVETLRKNKYHTINIGKMHFQYSFRPYKKKSKSMEDVMDWIDNKIRVEKIKKFKAEPYYGFEEVEVTIGHGDKVVGHYTDWLEEKGPSGLKVKEYIEK
ncbi:MAG: sulfatase-like hydrolase/transferase, partial [archaeon]|nr:sulfatase-like hydrolase/transferase [archaeon]